jgi:hypothetical protein
MPDPETLRVSIKYEGPDVDDGTMAVGDIIHALHGFANAYEKIASFEGLSHDHRLRLVGLTQSSAELHIKVLEWIGTNATALKIIGGFASGIVTTIVTVIGLKKHAAGKQCSVSATSTGNVLVENHLHVSLEVPPRDYEVFRSELIDNELNKLVSPLSEKKVNDVIISSPEIAASATIEASEKKFFEIETKTVTTTREVWVEGFLDSLSKSRNRGTFYLKGGRSVPYKLASENPVDLYIDFAYNGPVRVRCLASLDENLEPVQLDIYEIQKVQSSLFNH